jgi:hypothetical protein
VLRAGDGGELGAGREDTTGVPGAVRRRVVQAAEQQPTALNVYMSFVVHACRVLEIWFSFLF